jgi:hypothetical protein
MRLRTGSAWSDRHFGGSPRSGVAGQVSVGLCLAPLESVCRSDPRCSIDPRRGKAAISAWSGRRCCRSAGAPGCHLLLSACCRARPCCAAKGCARRPATLQGIGSTVKNPEALLVKGMSRRLGRKSRILLTHPVAASACTSFASEPFVCRFPSAGTN